MSSVIEIPVTGESGDGSEVLEVEKSELSNAEMMQQIRKILVDELAPIRLFLEFAVEGYRQNLITEFVEFSKLCLLTVQSKPDAYRGQESQHSLLINSLLAHYLQQARSTTDKERHSYVQKATELLNLAQKVKRRDSLTHVQKGNLLAFKGDLDAAATEYAAVLKDDPKYLPALLSQASIYEYKNDYKKALAAYQLALRLSPDLNPDVRSFIAHCYHKLGMTNEARYAYGRVLERNSDNLDALVSLSIMDFNAHSSSSNPDDKEIHLQNSNVRLSKAFGINPLHEAVAIAMADRLFRRGDYEKASTISKYVSRKAKNKKIRAEGFCIFGKILQINGQYELALKSFEKSLAANKESLIVQYALGQLFTFQGNLDAAIESYKAVLVKEPQNYEALKRLATIYSKKPGEKAQAIECLERLRGLLRSYKDEDTTKMSSPSKKNNKKDDVRISDPELLIEYGRVYEDTDVAISLTVFEREKEAVAPELYNNIGALYYGNSNFPKAKEYYTNALRCIETNASEFDTNEQTQTTVLYNIGRLYETEMNSEKAEEFYRKVQDSHPSYADANIRLAMMKMDVGNTEAIEAMFQDVLIMDPKNVSANLFLGQCKLEKKLYRDARKSFEKVLQDIDSHDTYALCQIGNLYIQFARNEPKKEQKIIFFKRAFEFFDKCLKVDNQNFCAALGVGICFAENDRIEDAREIFGQIQGCSSSYTPGAAVNLAHVFVELGQPRPAVAMYEGALKKHYEGKSAYILQCIARAYYIIAKTEKDAGAMKSALRYIQLAARLNPSDLSLFYNIALIKQQYAHVLNEQPSEKRPLNEHTKALEGLEISRIMFQSLGEISSDGKLGYDLKHAKERFHYCKDVKRQSEKKIHETIVLEKQRLEWLERIKADEEKREQELALEVERERIAAQERQEIIESKRRELQQRIQEDNTRALSYADDGPVKKARKLANEEASSDGERKKKLSKKNVVSSDEDL